MHTALAAPSNGVTPINGNGTTQSRTAFLALTIGSVRTDLAIRTSPILSPHLAHQNKLPRARHRADRHLDQRRAVAPRKAAPEFWLPGKPRNRCTSRKSILAPVKLCSRLRRRAQPTTGNIQRSPATIAARCFWPGPRGWAGRKAALSPGRFTMRAENLRRSEAKCRVCPSGAWWLRSRDRTAASPSSTDRLFPRARSQAARAPIRVHWLESWETITRPSRKNMG